MCGIVGKLYFNESRAVDQGQIRRMATALAHRGPDDAGEYVKGTVGLGHRRLSIIDLSPAGHQPMSNADGSVWIVFNGEIYNFLELRPKLERLGYVFRSHTDTEAIIHLYEEYGEECLQYLRGMFAFAIWDERKQKLFIARDRVGKKPLKYYVGDGFLVFASELKAFFHDPAVPREPDWAAIHHYLSFQYVPQPLTGFKGIRKLPPGHYLVVQHGTVTIKRYWQLQYREKLTLHEEEWKQAILSKLDEAVRLRMVADVPLGAFLSGGVDSSAVVGLMAKHSSRPVKTFTIGFQEASHNELPYAKAVAQHFGTDHTEFIVEPKALDILPKLVAHYEEPYADSSAVPTYYVSQLTRQHVTVVLNGDGGDENFAGYGRYNIQKFTALYDRVPSTLREHVIRRGATLLASLAKTTFTDRARRFADSFSEGRYRRYLEYVCYFNEQQKRVLYTPPFTALVGSEDSQDLMESWFQSVAADDVVDQAVGVDIASYLPDDLLVKVDIAAMAVSLEGRSPLLDHELMELTARMPSNLKIRRGQNKYIFKRALEGFLPHETLYRKKMGFGVPIEHWFRGELKQYIREQLLSPQARARGIFRPEAVEALIDEHQTTRINHAHQLWALLTLELWFQQYIDPKTWRTE